MFVIRRGQRCQVEESSERRINNGRCDKEQSCSEWRNAANLHSSSHSISYFSFFSLLSYLGSSLLGIPASSHRISESVTKIDIDIGNLRADEFAIILRTVSLSL